MSIVQRDKVLSSYNGNLESVMIYNDAEEKITVPNGVFVTLGELGERGRETKKAFLADDPTKEVLLIDSPEVNYEAGKGLDDFVNEAGKVARAFRLSDGDVITLTEDLFAEGANLAVGQELAVGTEGKLADVPLEGEVAIKFVIREDAKYELTRKQKSWRLDIVK